MKYNTKCDCKATSLDTATSLETLLETSLEMILGRKLPLRRKQLTCPLLIYNHH